MDASQQRRVTGHDALPSSAPAPLARQNSEEGGAPYTYICVHNARSDGGNRKPDAHLPGSRPFAPSCLCCFLRARRRLTLGGGHMDTEVLGGKCAVW